VTLAGLNLGHEGGCIVQSRGKEHNRRRCCENTEKEGDSEAAAWTIRMAVPWCQTERRGKASVRKEKKKVGYILIFDAMLSY
jgi:hypothetical protein